MFDKDNFVKALMYLMQEAYFNNQDDLVIILNNTIHQIHENAAPDNTLTPAADNKYSDIIQSFMKLDKHTQRLMVNALDLTEFAH